MLQEGVNFTDFKIVRCLEIDTTTLKLYYHSAVIFQHKKKVSDSL